MAHGAVGAAAIVHQISGIGRARWCITTARGTAATGATGRRTIGRPRLFVIPLITAQEPGRATTARQSAGLPSSCQRGPADNPTGEAGDARLPSAAEQTAYHQTSALTGCQLPSRPRKGRHRIGHRRIGLRRRTSRQHRRDRRRRTGRHLIRIGHRTSREHRNRAGTANGVRASHEFAIILAQLRSGGAHSRSLGFARDDKVEGSVYLCIGYQGWGSDGKTMSGG